MNIDLAIGGMDQRKAHMYMRDVSQRWGWAATCLHTPIISGLNATGGRMETFDHKMSKSDPRGAICFMTTAEEKCERPTLTLLMSTRRCTNSQNTSCFQSKA